MPTATTEAGFSGLTNAQAFLEIATSPSITAAHAGDVDTFLTNIVGQSVMTHA